CCPESGFSTGTSRQPAGSPFRKSCRAIQHPHQRPVAGLLRLGRRPCLAGRDRGLPLTENTMKREVPLVHPGEILLKDWLEPLGISQYALAKAIDVPRRRINEIVQGNRAITADTAARLGAFFGVDAEGWLALQAHYDTEIVRERLGDVLSHIPRYDRIARPPLLSHRSSRDIQAQNIE